MDMRKYLIISMVFVAIFAFGSCENKKKGTIYDNGNTGNTGNSGNSGDSGDSGDTGLPDNNSVADEDTVTKDDDETFGDSDSAYNDEDEIKDDSEDLENDENDENEIPDAFADTDADNEIPDENKRVMTAVILFPTYSSIHEAGKPFQIKGEVSDTKYPSDKIDVKWEIKKGAVWETLFESKADSAGITVFQHTIPENEAAYFALRLTATAPDSLKFTSHEKIFGICTYPFGGIQDFNGEFGDGWVIAGDAYRDSEGSNGWLELTGNENHKKGLIYNNLLKVYPGDTTIKVDIRTGQPGVPVDTGADGFAVTIFDAENIVSLEDYAGAVRTGGCLGYGVVGDHCRTGVDMEISAFHIEFDTWYNVESGIEDPTTENHIAINLNGDPGGHLLWEEVVDLEDNEWHHIEVTTQGTKVTVEIDGNVIIDDDIEGFSFRGGYVFFSGSTGGSKNFHSIDNLEVVQECRVP